jgi:hypothetical protein
MIEDLLFIRSPFKWEGGREKFCSLFRKNNNQFESAKLISFRGEIPTTIFILDFNGQIIGKKDYSSSEEILQDGWLVE